MKIKARNISIRELKNRRELLKLPERKGNDVTFYSSILIVPSGLKHDSGYMMIAIIGIIDGEPKEICAYPDDICWDFTNFHQKYESTGMRTDCYYPTGILHFWGNGIQFMVGSAFSSTTISVLNREYAKNQT